MSESALTEKKERLWSPNFIKICVISLIIGLALNMTNSTISLYINALYGENVMSGVLSVGFAVASVACRLVGGRLSDRFGRTLFLNAGMLVCAVAVLGLGLSKSMALLVVLRILQGMGHSMANTTSTALGVDVTPQSRMNEGTSFVTMGFFLAAAVSATLVLDLVGDNGAYLNSFLFVAVILVLGVILSATCRFSTDPQYIKNQELAKRENQNGTSGKGAFSVIEPRAVPAAALFTLISFAFSILTSFLLVHANEAGIENAGWYFTISAIMSLVTRLFAGRLADKYGPVSVLLPALICGVVGFVILAATTNQALFFLSGALYGVLNGISGPICYTHAIQSSPKDRRGSATATYYLSTDIAHGFGTMIWAVIIDAIGFAGAFTISAATLAVTVVLAFPILRWRPKQEA